MSISVIKVRHNIHEERRKIGGEVNVQTKRGREKKIGKGFTTLHFQNERLAFSSLLLPFVFPKSLPELIENLDLGSKSKSINSPSGRIGLLGSGVFLGTPVIWE